MSIISRLFTLGKATANQVLDNLEKPEAMLEQAIRDKESQIADLRKSVASCIATTKRTEAQLRKELAEKDTWEARAEQALKVGREDLTLKALTKAKEHEEHANNLDQQWKSQSVDVNGLKADLQKQTDQLSDYKRNKDFIIAQSKFAESKKAISDVRSKMGRGRDIDDLMSRMKNKAERSMHEADAMAELKEGGSSLDKEFAELQATTGDAAINSKLAEMKARLGTT